MNCTITQAGTTQNRNTTPKYTPYKISSPRLTPARISWPRLRKALPVPRRAICSQAGAREAERVPATRSEEHTSELQSHLNLVCRLLLEKKKKQQKTEFRRYGDESAHHDVIRHPG